MPVKVSVVIPTYNHLLDCLKPCIESIIKHTNLEDIEIIVVANGCKDGTKDYIDSLGSPFKLIWVDEGIGYTKATNIGIKAAEGEYVVLLNNDIILLDRYPKHTWIDMLLKPFEEGKCKLCNGYGELASLVPPKHPEVYKPCGKCNGKGNEVGITGPLQLHDNYADRDILIFFCVMIKKDTFDKIGLLDEIYSPGGGEDIDFCAKLQDKGYKQVVVPSNDLKFTTINVGGFPIYHKGEGTFSESEFPEYGNKIIKDNGLLNAIRYNKHIKLNVGSGGVEVPGYLSVDKYDTRANILMDVLDLELPENSVEEILASHLFEHVNPYHSVELLKKWLKILKPGGKLIMELPNIEELCKDFVTANKQQRYGILNCIYGAVNTKESGDKSEITSPHLWGWYPEMLYDHLGWAGFANIVFGPEQIPHPLKNFRVEAIKPLFFRDFVDHFIYHNIKPGESILDIGCGDKLRTKMLVSNKITSVDAWEKVKPDVLLDLEKESLPFAENSYDVVLMIDFIEHLDKEVGKRLLEEAKKVCKKKIILLTPSFWTDNLDNVNNPELWCYQNKYDGHKSFWTNDDFKDWDEGKHPDAQFLLKVWNKK